MSRRKKIVYGLLILLVLLLVGIFVWKIAHAPTVEPIGNVTPSPVPNPNPNPTPEPATTGILVGHADTATLHINKIIVYNSTGTSVIYSLNLESTGDFRAELAPGDYMVDYQAAPDLYPHSKEAFTIVAGQTHEVDITVEK